MRKKLLGAEHPDTLTSLSSLALMYSNQGKWNEVGVTNLCDGHGLVMSCMTPLNVKNVETL